MKKPRLVGLYIYIGLILPRYRGIIYNRIPSYKRAMNPAEFFLIGFTPPACDQDDIADPEYLKLHFPRWHPGWRG